MDLQFELTGKGWCKCMLNIEGKSVTITASYLGDALGTFLEALVNLANGSKSVGFAWQEEPGEYRWLLEKNGNQLRLRITEMHNTYSKQHDECGKKVLDATVLADDFLYVGYHMAKRVFEKYGKQGYQDLWGSPFPVDAMNRLHREA